MSFFRRFLLDLNNASGDAYGRLRTGAPFVSFEDKMLFAPNPEVWDDQEESGAGTTSVYNVDKASNSIGVALNTAGVRTRQSFKYVNHEEGLSRLIYLTGVLDGNAIGNNSGVIRMFGIGNDDDGYFVHDNGVDYGLVLRKSTSGVPVDLRVAQSAWDIDPFDGTGPSKITIDFSLIQTFVIDMSWLGRVRFGFQIGGEILYAHDFNISNAESIVGLRRPTLPIRYQIINDGTGPVSELEQISASVIAEGAAPIPGGSVYGSTGGTNVDANVITLEYLIMAARIKTGFAGVQAAFDTFSLLSDSGDAVEWFMMLNPTFSAPPVWFDPTAGSPIEFTSGAGTAITVTGRKLSGGFLSGGTASNPSGGGAQASRFFQMGVGIDGVGIPLVIAVRPVTTNANIFGSLSVKFSG